MKLIYFVHAVLSISLSSLVSSVVASGAALATFKPCPSCPKNKMPAPITITKQYQAVSTCKPKPVCKTKGHKSQCHTEYPYSTYDWVSTKIPCSGIWGKTCTVTKTDEIVTVNRVSTSVTSYTTLAVPSYKHWGKHTKTTTVYTTKVAKVDVIVIDYTCPFNEVGPHAIGGYGGSGLCKRCGPDNSKVEKQTIAVHKCVNGKCQDNKETWYWSPPTKTQTTQYQPCTTSQVASTPGVYTITIAPETCTTTSVPHPTTITYLQTTYVCPTKGIYTHTLVPETCVTTTIAQAPTTIWITTTITRTYTVTKTDCATYANGSTVPPPVYATTTAYTSTTTTTTESHGYPTKTTKSDHPTTQSTKHPTKTHPHGPDPSSDMDWDEHHGHGHDGHGHDGQGHDGHGYDGHGYDDQHGQDGQGGHDNHNGHYDKRDERVAKAIEYREFPGPSVVRRGGVLRVHRDEEASVGPLHVRDFGIKKRALL